MYAKGYIAAKCVLKVVRPIFGRVKGIAVKINRMGGGLAWGAVRSLQEVTDHCC